MPAKERRYDLPVAQLAQHSRTLSHIISLCSQRWNKDPDITSLSEFCEVIEAAKVYRMDGVMQLVETLLLKSPLLKQEALGAFAVAKYYGLAASAIVAAKHTLSLPLFCRVYHPELDRITAGDYVRLQIFYTTCQEAFCAKIKPPGPSKNSYTWMTRDSFTWLTCTSCLSSDHSIYTSNMQVSKPSQWWCDYLEWISSSFSQNPSLNILQTEGMDCAISLADRCKVCRKRVAQDVKDFNKMLLVELDVIICANAQNLVASKHNLHNSKTLSPSAGKPHTPKPVEVRHIFNDSNEDLTIRTADDISFRVHRLILSLSVPVFAAMFTLPQAPVGPGGSTPADTTSSASPSIVDVSEGSETMQQFLQFCYPAADPDIGSLEGIQAILEAATKYDSDEIKRRVAKRLDEFLTGNTLRVYAIAHRYKLEREVRMAAKYLLPHRIPVTYVAELDFIPASAYHQLQKYHVRCQSVAFQKFQTGGFSWIPFSSSQGINATRFIWFTCRKCPGSPEVKIAANLAVKPTKWWSNYMESVSEILSNMPYHSTEALIAAKDHALEAAVKCSGCQVKVIPQMTEFQSRITAVIRAAVNSVELKVTF